MRHIKFLLLASACAGVHPASALAQTEPASDAALEASRSDSSDKIADIVVTAQKRSERLNDVPMSVSAATGETLVNRGISDTMDLGKLVAGFKASISNALTPVYTLRGIGLYESGLASSPAVSVYVDEVPLPYPVMTKAAGLDVQRVEVLKGPQGTLFGQNSTGGAVNYIAAKPTDEFKAGGNLTFSRFDKIEADGFVSGPLSETVRARIAARAISGGAWQKSVSRPGDTLGDQRQLQGRLILDWTATSRLNFSLALAASRDNSDTIAGQLIDVTFAVPSRAEPSTLLSLTPLSGTDARAADWTAKFSNQARDRFYQGALRSEFEISDAVSLVSITDYAKQLVRRDIDYDGSTAVITQVAADGRIGFFNQELRLVGSTPKLKWILGASYDHANVQDHYIYDVGESSTVQPLPFLPPYRLTGVDLDQKIDTYAAFGNASLNLTDRITANAGVRYTKADRRGTNCSSDPDPAQPLTAQFNGLQQLFISLGAKTTPFSAIPPGGCIALTPAPDLSPAGPVALTLKEDNISWRLGLDYKTDGGTLIYGNVSRGYKAGVISPLAAVLTSTVQPIKQEKVDAYEIGMKIPLADRRLQLNAAAFYYKYTNKQLRGRFLDPIFALLETLQNVPQSRIWGLEAEMTARPTRGLNLSMNATYLNTKITDTFQTFNAQGAFGDFEGSRLPYTPKVSLVADAEYEHPVGPNLEIFGGGSVTYNSATNTTFVTNSLGAPFYNLNSYALVDLRLGVGASDGSWRAQVFGRNITNKFYVVNASNSNDVTARFPGMPATYGITLSFRTP